MRYLLIKGGKAVINRKIQKRDILIFNGRIQDDNFFGEIPPGCKVIDADGKYVSAGFIDMHAHGGGGYDFMDCSEKAFSEISQVHLKNGTTTMIPTAVSSSFDNLVNLIKTYKKYKDYYLNFAGIHLEGPYISKEQKGAHKEKYLHAPNDYETSVLLEEGKGIIKRITAAPELEGMESFAEKMVQNGIGMSIGHSNAVSETALHALNNNFTHITHLYSATPSVRKIDQTVKAGVIEAAYLHDETSVELIADGKHAAVDALKLAVKIKGIDKVALVTDALRPAGTDVSESWLGEKIPENRIIIEDGVAKLPDRSSFAGSIATTGMLLKKGVFHYGFSIGDTVQMLTKTPAAILGLEEKGAIEKGYIADAVIFDEKLNICNVIIRGQIVNGG